MPVRPLRALVCALLASVVAAPVARAADPPVEPIVVEPDLARLGYVQHAFQEGPRLVWRIDTRVRWTRADLERRRLCLIPSQPRRTLPRRIACLVLTERGAVVRREHELASGEVVARRVLPGAKVSFRGHRIRVTILLDALGLHPGNAATRSRVQSSGPDCIAPPPEEPPPTTDPPTEPPAAAEPPPVRCSLLAPRRAAEPLALVAGPLLQCEPSGASYRTRGPSTRRAVALTFDDGPWSLTTRFLDVLEREHVHGTFFMIGQQVGARAATVRRMVAEGHDVANHSWTHANLGGGGPAATSELSRTSAAIERATGQRPCLFRAPYGSVGSDLINRARKLGMLTIQWSADPLNWRRPGADVIASRLLAQASPGGILLMHDGGGDRSQTLAALPQVIAGLRERGYEMVSLTDLLGLDGERGWPDA